MSKLSEELKTIMANKFDITKQYVFSAAMCGTEWAKEYDGSQVKVINSDEGVMKIEKGTLLQGIKRGWCNEIVENGFKL